MSTGQEQTAKDDLGLYDKAELDSTESDPADVYRTETVTATASGPKTVTVTGTNVYLLHDMDTPVEVGDKVKLAGTTGADGTYTVASVDSDTQVTVVEAIAASTGGTAKFIHRMGAKRVAYSGAVTGVNVFEALQNLNTTVGGQFAFKTISTPTSGPVVADQVDDTLTLTSSDSSVSITGTAGSDTIDIKVISSAVIAAVILTSTDTVQTTSPTYVDMPSMTFTVVDSGKYFVMFSSDLENSNNKRVSVVISASGADEPHSERSQDLSSNKRQVFQTQALISSITAGQIIKIRWTTDGGVASSYHRSLALFRLQA